MTKKSRKIWSLVLAVTLIFTAFSCAFEAYANCDLGLTVPKNLTGDQALDIVEVAKANLSKTGSQLGATEHWCADFVYNCARKANIGEEVIPQLGRVSDMQAALLKCGAKTVTKPQAGDLVFYGPSHVGIMADSTYAYQGNFSGKGSGASFWTSSKVVYCKYTSATNYAQYGAVFIRPAYKKVTLASNAKTLTLTYCAGGGNVDSDTYCVKSDILCKKSGAAVKDVWTYNQAKKYGLYNRATFGLYKTGYHFVGWKNSAGAVFDQNDATVLPKQIEPSVSKKSCEASLTAVWEINNLSVSYNANGGTVDSTKYCLDEATGDILKAKTKEKVSVNWVYNETKSAGLYNASTFSLKRDGYKFLGWSTSPEGGKVINQNDATVRPTDMNKAVESQNAEAIMYASWEKLHTHIPETDAAVEPTCTQTGLTEGSHCSECKVVIVSQKSVPALGHSFGEVVTDSEPTCTADGRTSRHCERCEDVTDITVLPATGHEIAATVKAPTCTAKGYTSNKCKKCGYSEKTDIKSALGHTYYNKVSEKATLTEDGSYSTVCKLCGKVKKTYKTYKIKSVTLSKTEYIYNKKTAKPSATVRDIKGNILENGTDYTVKYPEKSILPGSYTVKITLKGKYSGSVKLSFTIAPRTVKNVKTVSSSAGKAKVIYTAVTGATGYEVFYSTGKTGPYKKLASTKTTSYTRSGLTRGRTYYFKIRAYKYSGGERIYGGFSKASRVTVI